MAKKIYKSMDELLINYNQFIKGKEVSKNGKLLFNQAIKKAVKTKQRASK